MTVRYHQRIATVRCGGFVKLLLRWQGSIYKLVGFELFVFLFIYTILSLTYHFVMNSASKRTFETIAQYCNKYSEAIPLSFVLGFYVQRVISRFWEQFNSIPWPNRMAIYVSTYVQCNDERARMMRRTIMRYLCLSFVMTMSSVSPQIKKRFPTLTHMTEAGFLMANEQLALESIKTSNNKYFVPFVWATSIISKARKEGKIKSDVAVQTLVSEINDFRGNCGNLFMFDWVSIPLGYTQVVVLAVYIFSLSCLLGRYQFEVGAPAEKHFPFFTILQFVFYMGWLKVAECGLSPFGEDDDDFDINLLVDRYLHESYMVVDEIFMKAPDILKDQHWDLVDFEIPYTEASAPHKKNIFLGSATGMEIPADQQAFVEASLVDLKKASSVGNAQSVLDKRIKRRKKTHALSEASDSKESVVLAAGGTGTDSVGKIKPVDTAAKPAREDDQKPTEQQQPAVELKPSTSAERKASTPGGVQQQTAPEEPQPTASNNTILTQQESSLMAKIQDELRELRSK